LSCQGVQSQGQCQGFTEMQVGCRTFRLNSQIHPLP
jgi:hypothetical protein